MKFKNKQTKQKRRQKKKTKNKNKKQNKKDNTTVIAVILCPAVYISDVTNKAGMCDKTIQPCFVQI